jgi:two-component system response regulator LytT
MNLKVKIIAKKENYEKYSEMLKKSGFIISEDADLVFKEKDYHSDSFLGKKDDKYEVIHYSKILYVESYGHDVYLKTQHKDYLVKERLYEVESILSEHHFIRINKSMIVNKYGIKEIIPSLNSRLTLIMKNDDVVYVTRSYLQIFKEFIGF